MSRRPATPAQCARALWLLGLEPPVTADRLAAVWRDRVGRTHPDRHAGSDVKVHAATVLTSALNDAREVVSEWIASGRDWPRPNGERVISLFDPDPDDGAADDAAESPEEPAPVCKRTGLRRGDRVVLRPYDGALATVDGTEVEAGRGRMWVRLADAPPALADQVRLAAFGCPVCGFCAGPAVDDPTDRPCPDCLRDLRLLDRRPAEADRVRTAIEARSEAGRAAARALGDDRLAERARERGRWARRLLGAEPDDLRDQLVEAFTRAYERWGATPAATR
jgi:hypothetical protein